MQCGLASEEPRSAQAPPPVGVSPHAIDPLLADICGEHRAEPVPPQPHRLVADVDAALEQQIFHVAERQRVFDIHHHHQADHLGRAVEIAKRVLGPGHAAGLRCAG